VAVEASKGVVARAVEASRDVVATAVEASRGVVRAVEAPKVVETSGVSFAAFAQETVTVSTLLALFQFRDPQADLLHLETALQARSLASLLHVHAFWPPSCTPPLCALRRLVACAVLVFVSPIACSKVLDGQHPFRSRRLERLR